MASAAAGGGVAALATAFAATAATAAANAASATAAIRTAPATAETAARGWPAFVVAVAAQDWDGATPKPNASPERETDASSCPCSRRLARPCQPNHFIFIAFWHIYATWWCRPRPPQVSSLTVHRDTYTYREIYDRGLSANYLTKGIKNDKKPQRKGAYAGMARAHDLATWWPLRYSAVTGAP